MTQEPIEKFWMVWGLQRNYPRYRHATKQAAQTEAKRLSGEAPGELFVVLATVDAYISTINPPESVQLVKATNGELTPSAADIPF